MVRQNFPTCRQKFPSCQQKFPTCRQNLPSAQKTTVALLEKLRLDRYIRIEKQPDKEAMGDMDDESLAQMDAVRKTKDDFFCEADREEVNKDLVRQAG
jgi:hypothetical protein